MNHIEHSENNQHLNALEKQDNIPFLVNLHLNLFREQIDDIWIPGFNDQLFIDINPIHFEFYEKTQNATNQEEINKLLSLIKNDEILTKVITGNREFFLTRIFSSNKKECLGFVKINDQNNDTYRIEPRIFYRSVSEGSWRVTSSANFNKQQGVYYGKGLFSNTGLYSFETRLSKDLEIALEDLDNKNSERHLSFNSRKKYKSLIDLFYEHRECYELNKKMNNDYENEIELLTPSIFNDYQKQLELYISLLDNPDLESKLQEEIKNDKNDYAFIKNAFLLDTYLENHELLGDSVVYVFEDIISCDNEPLEWHISYHKRTNTIQIKKIEVRNNKTSSFGNQSRLVDPGILTTKAIDYKFQHPGSINLTEKLNNSHFNIKDDDTLKPFPNEYRTYISTRPLLESFKVIKKFREFINVPEYQ